MLATFIFIPFDIRRDSFQDRPILIYIYNDNRSEFFSIDLLEQFFAENYIVRSWNISNEIARQEFAQILYIELIFIYVW